MTDPYYDIGEDWELIVASFQSMYGIRLPRQHRLRMTVLHGHIRRRPILHHAEF